MIEEILVSNILSDAMVRVGAELIRMVMQNKLNIDMAAWIYSDESAQWRMTFAFPDLHSRGSRQAYQRIQAILAQMPHFPLSLQHTSVADSNEPFIRALGYAIAHSDATYGVRLRREVIQGIYIDDAYVYRLSTVMDTDPVKTSANGAARPTAMPTEL